MYPIRRSTRSAMGLSLDEVLNAAYLQDLLMKHTVKMPGPHSCWMWDGPVSYSRNHGRLVPRATLFVLLERGGYCRMGVARLVYLLDAGTLEDKRRIKHTCGESLCVRPSHIVLAPQNKTYWSRIKPRRKQQEREELARIAAARAVAGVDGDTVSQIQFYAWLGEPIKSLARSYGLKQEVVERILGLEQDAPRQLQAI